MEAKLENALRDVWQHLTADRQAWLLGAGVSHGAGIPLMYPLTEYVQTLVGEESAESAALLASVRAQLPDDCHIEHVLSHLGDLIALALRSKAKKARIANEDVGAEQLQSLHAAILRNIGQAVRYGYRSPTDDAEEVRGSATHPIVSVTQHRAFVRKVFASRAKPGFQQTPLNFFTTNYDTLVEDALALEQIPYLDGFVGGGMAYWDPEVGFSSTSGFLPRAKVFKLHGSVDWHLTDEGVLVRCREGCAYPDRKNNLLIYPQSTKYVATQKDPFAALFAHFRVALATAPDNVLVVCGYSFGDDHIDGEIEAAMELPQSRTVIVAFAQERQVNDTFQLPEKLRVWLTERSWRDRVFVASSRGLYHGSLDNLCPDGATLDWWTFEGLTSYLAEGPDLQMSKVPQATDEPLAAAHAATAGADA